MKRTFLFIAGVLILTSCAHEKRSANLSILLAGAKPTYNVGIYGNKYRHETQVQHKNWDKNKKYNGR